MAVWLEEYNRMKMGTVTCRVFECGGATR